MKRLVRLLITFGLNVVVFILLWRCVGYLGPYLDQGSDVLLLFLLPLLLLPATFLISTWILQRLLD
ncbi:hypothetical protein [Symbiobacterium terraclitae]|uniref:hypothetical protein n=1 Tax=Symbiobacterium terraclitae TaxID=557451 RepID=UPI0035B5018A